ncbi:MAG: PilN domain-containing protein [Nostocaceae cyanobacterium]|nr:PilN domain-containing protein [Nostocaceae cyanobacterium]
MYSLDINFLKDRPNQQQQGGGARRGVSIPAGERTPLMLGLIVGLLLPAILGGGWWFLAAQNDQLAQDIAQLDAENKRLDREIGNINQIKAQTQQIRGETQALASVFNHIRPWSAMLRDMSERIPQNVQIETITQIAPPAQAATQPTPTPTPAAGATPAGGKPALQAQQTPAPQPPPDPGGVEITGYARTFNDVNDFLLTVQQSRFFKPTETRIVSAELVDAPLPPGVANRPGVIVKPTQIVKYKIQSSLSDVPASELIRELDRKGAVGLRDRIFTLQRQGVIQK